jgi:hypothetical protein
MGSLPQAKSRKGCEQSSLEPQPRREVMLTFHRQRVLVINKVYFDRLIF